jgi:hypothetical protein
MAIILGLYVSSVSEYWSKISLAFSIRLYGHEGPDPKSALYA